MNCNLCFKLVRSLYHTHLWSGWCSQLLVNNLRLVWIQKHYTKGYTKNRVQDLIFVPYNLQNQMNEIEGKNYPASTFLINVVSQGNCEKQSMSEILELLIKYMWYFIRDFDPTYSL